MNVHIFTFNLFQEHTMVAWKEAGRCVVIDPGFYSDGESLQFFGWMEENGMKAEAVMITHGHLDHISGVKDVQDRFGGIPVYMNDADTVELDYDLDMSRRLGLKEPKIDFKCTNAADGDVIEAAGMRFKVITTPGHSPGGVCYLEEEAGIMFTGDTLFAGTIGRTDFKFSSYDDEIRSIMEKLVWLDGDIVIYPGHGGTSTIARERTTNPFLEPFNEKEELECLSSDELPHD